MTELYTVGNPINRSERNNLNATFQDIRNEVARTYMRIDYVLNEVNGVKSQLNNTIIQGDSSVESAQARIGYDNTNYPTLKARLDAEIELALEGGGGSGLIKATAQQALEGTNNETYMTPYRVNNVTGTLTDLETSVQTSLVDAINELFTDVDDGKTLIADAITSKGVPTSANATFTEMAENIDEISTGPLPPVTGTISSTGAAGVPFTCVDGTSLNFSSVVVSGLGFIPSMIQLIASDNDPYGKTITVYFGKLGTRDGVISIFGVPNTSLTSTSRAIRNNVQSAYVNNTGFSLPVSSANTSYTWTAYR